MLAVVASVAVAIAFPGSASAKGPTQAVIRGPGLERPIPLRDPSSREIGPRLSSMVEDSGFWDRLWCRHCHGRFDRPAGVLGPRYTVRYVMAPDVPTPGRITQYVYPYAEAGPVTFMPRDQRYWGRERTAGGWFVARPRLKRLLIEIGLPATAPQVISPSPPPPLSAVAGGGVARWPVLPVSILAVALVGAAVILLTRRRTHRAPAL